MIFANVVGISTDGVPAPLFYFTGTLIWGFFSRCIQSTSGVLVGNQQIFSKVYFPRMIVPLSTIITAFIAFLIQSTILIAMYIYYYCQGADIHLNAWAFTIPLMCLIMGVMGLAMGIIISSVTTKSRPEHVRRIWHSIAYVLHADNLPSILYTREISFLTIIQPVSPSSRRLQILDTRARHIQRHHASLLGRRSGGAIDDRTDNVQQSGTKIYRYGLTISTYLAHIYNIKNVFKNFIGHQ